MGLLAGWQGQLRDRPFLDVGTGLPTGDNTHQVAQRIAPRCRIVYVDNDPLVLVHARALLTSSREGASEYVDADLQDTDRIVSEAARTLNFAKPVALIMNGIMGHVADDDQAYPCVRRLVAALPSGSYLALSDGTDTNEAGVRSMELYRKSGAIPYQLRSPDRIATFFDGLDLIEPGVVALDHWRPESAPRGGGGAGVPSRGGVARKP